MNNFGWDFIQSDNLTYASSGLGLLVAYISHKRIKNPLDFALTFLNGILPLIEEQYKDNKDVLKMLKGFDKAIKEYESSQEEEINDDIESEEEENDEKNDEALVRCTGVCSCSDDDDGCC